MDLSTRESFFMLAGALAALGGSNVIRGQFLLAVLECVLATLLLFKALRTSKE